MDCKTFIAAVVEHIAWPCVAVVAMIVFRKDLRALLGLVTHAKIRDFEVWFRENVSQNKSQADVEKIPEVKEDELHFERERVRKNPEKGVLDAWANIEGSMYEKLREKLPAGHQHLKNLTLDRADTIFSILGALPPRTNKIVHNMGHLSYCVKNFQDEVPFRDAWEYVVLAKRIQNSIEAMTELPIIKLSPFTSLAMQLNAAIDSGKYAHIGMTEVKKHLRDGSIFKFLKVEVGEDIDLSLLTAPDSCYPGFVEYYNKRMESFVNAYSGNEGRKWGVEKQGLCLLLAWTLEIIQQGSGWHPPEE